MPSPPSLTTSDSSGELHIGPGKYVQVPPSLPPVAENHVDAPWLDLDLGEDFDPNSRSLVEKGLGLLLEPVKSKFLSSQSDLAQVQKLLLSLYVRF